MMVMNIVIVVLFFFAINVIAQGNFEKMYLSEYNPEAVCNDGSSAVYYFRRGYGSGSGIWTIYLEGGGHCADITTCQERWNATQHFMTSTQLPDILNDTTMSQDVNHWGINSGNATANPHFYNVNQAYLWYCSSDTHAGNVGASKETGGWHFRGRVIVQTLIEHLLSFQNPAMTQAKQILFTGFSAGGMGVLNNVDFVGEIVKKAAPGATYKAYADSGWVMDLPQYYDAQVSRDSIQDLYNNFNAQFDETCVNALEPYGQGWRCVYGDIVSFFITTPIFMAQYHYDIPSMNGVEPPFNSSTWEYVTLIKKNMLMQTESRPSFFSSACYCHGVEMTQGGT